MCIYGSRDICCFNQGHLFVVCSNDFRHYILQTYCNIIEICSVVYCFILIFTGSQFSWFGDVICDYDFKRSFSNFSFISLRCLPCGSL